MLIAVRDKRGTHRVAAQGIRLVSADEDGAFLEFVDTRTDAVVATVHLPWADLRTLRDGATALLKRRAG